MRRNKVVQPDLKYTICFIQRGDEVLMLYRARVPNKDKWNGVGGKIEPGERIVESMQREIREEVGIDVPVTKLHYAGDVMWEIPGKPMTGMYVFITQVDEKPFAGRSKATPEGLLSWKKISWVTNKKNDAVVDNIHYFLPEMLKAKEPIEYVFTYDHEMVMSTFRANHLM